MEVRLCNLHPQGACWSFFSEFPIHAGARDDATV